MLDGNSVNFSKCSIADLYELETFYTFAQQQARKSRKALSSIKESYEAIKTQKGLSEHQIESLIEFAEEGKGLKKSKKVISLSEERLSKIRDRYLVLFQKHFRRRIEKVAKERICYPNLPKEFRRLDSMARLIEGNSICAAVYFHLSERKLWIFNNKVHHSSRDKNGYIENMNAVFELISNQALTIEKIFKKLAKVISLNVAQENRYDLVRIGLKVGNLNPVIIEYLENMFQSGLDTKTWKTNLEFRSGKIVDDRFNALLIKKISKTTRDFLKIRDFLLNTHTHDLLPSGLLFAIRKKRFEIKYFDTKDVHAEMRALSHLVTDLTLTNQYIGISKLCCDHCALAMQTFGQNTRGLHGQRTNWPLPDFLINNQQVFESYVGKQAFGLYDHLDDERKKKAKKFIESKECNSINENGNHGRRLYADSSDSDVETGPNFEDDEDRAIELHDGSLADNWTARDLQSYYRSELNFLLEDIELSLTQVVALFGESIDKFKALTQEPVRQFVDSYSKSQNESKNEIFEAISEYYDDDEKLFDAIIENEDSLVAESSIEDFVKSYRESIHDHDGRYEDSEGEEIDHVGAAQANIREEQGWDYVWNSDDSANRWGSGKSDSEGEEYGFYDPEELCETFDSNCNL